MGPNQMFARALLGVLATALHKIGLKMNEVASEILIVGLVAFALVVLGSLLYYLNQTTSIVKRTFNEVLFICKVLFIMMVWQWFEQAIMTKWLPLILHSAGIQNFSPIVSDCRASCNSSESMSDNNLPKSFVDE